jgi:hypothetical protein
VPTTFIESFISKFSLILSLELLKHQKGILESEFFILYADLSPFRKKDQQICANRAAATCLRVILRCRPRL